MNHLNYQIITKFLSYYAYSLTNQPAIDLILRNWGNPLFYVMYYYYFIILFYVNICIINKYILLDNYLFTRK